MFKETVFSVSGLKFIFTDSQLGAVFLINLLVQYSQCDLPPLRPPCGEVPGPRFEPGAWADL